MRRHASMRAVGYQLRKGLCQVPRISVCLKAAASPPGMGKACAPEPRAKGGGAPDGVLDHGTYEGDGPVTREALCIPLGRDPAWGAGEQTPYGYALARACGTWRQKKLERRGRPKARGTGAEVERCQGVGGPNMSDDGGEQLAPGPTRAKEHGCETAGGGGWPWPDRRERSGARAGMNRRRET
jgi:hypothetical protein